MSTSVKVTWLSVVVLAAVFMQLLVASPTNAATNAPRPEKVSAQARATIVERLDRMQRAPVIVRLDTEQARGQPLRDRRSAAFRAHKQQAIAERQTRVLERLGARRSDRRRHFRNLPFLALDVSPSELVALEAMPEVVSVEPDRLHAPSLNVSVPLIGGDAAWALVPGATGANQTVAIIDTGVDSLHAYFQRLPPGTGSRVLEAEEACFSTNHTGLGSTSLCRNGAEEQIGQGAAAPCEQSGCNHGTHVAGIAAADNFTYAGVAPEADIIAIQVFSWVNNPGICNGCLRAWTSDIIAALDYVLTLSSSHNIAAANLSIGGSTYTSISACPTSAASAIQDLLDAGIATVIAAGNDSSSNALASPGCIAAAITVGATDDNDAVASFSNSASWMDFFAPGRKIISAKPGSGTTSKSGTSMSAPHVAGAITALRSLRPDASVSELVAALTSTAVVIVDPDNGFSIPRIQVDAAAESILPGLDLPKMVIVDDDDAESETTIGSFEIIDSNKAYGGRARRATGSGLDVYTFTPRLSCSGVYRLYGWWPVLAGAGAAIEVDVYSDDGQPTTLSVDQTSGGGGWMAMGDFAFGIDELTNFVEIRSPGSSSAVADALRFDLLALDPFQFTIPDLPLAFVDHSYSAPIVSGNCNQRSSFSIVAGTLHPDFSLDPDTGVIFGTATVTSSSTLTVRVTNLDGEFDEFALTLEAVVNQIPQITSITALPSTVLDSGTSQLDVLAIDPDPVPNSVLTYTWLTPLVGALSVTDSATPIYTPPNVVGLHTFSLTVQVSDGLDVAEDTVEVAVQDNDPPPAVMPSLAEPLHGSIEVIANDFDGLDNINGLAFDTQGNLFGALQTSDPSGGVVHVDTSTGIVSSLVTGISRADQVIVHPNGSLFINNKESPAASTDRIYVAELNYETSVPVVNETFNLTTTTPINNPKGLVVLDQTSPYGPLGNLIVTEDVTNGRIIRLNDGAVQFLVDSDAGLQNPEGLAFGDFGGAWHPALYVGETGRNRIVRIEHDGSLTPFGDPTTVGLLSPNNLKFGWDGNLYVSEDEPNGRLIRIAADGAHSVVVGNFVQPQGLAFDPNSGDLHVANRGEATQDEPRIYALQWSDDYRDTHASVVLFDDLIGTLPDQQPSAIQPWLFFAYDSLGNTTQTTVADGVNLTTDAAFSAGYTRNLLNTDYPALQRGDGYELRFQLKVHDEDHSSVDRAGFSVIVLSDDLKGIELGFWANEIWAQSDLADELEPPSLFKHSEGAPFDTTAAEVAYRLVIEDNSYRLYANGLEILFGPLRDYSSFGAPYNIPGFVFLGDDTSSASANVTLGKIALWTATGFGASEPPTAPLITTVTASPSTISTTQTSALQVIASDADHAPNATLSYAWVVPAEGGSLVGATSASPVYTPPDLTGIQTFTLSVEVSDGATVATASVDVTLDASAPLLAITSPTAGTQLTGSPITVSGTIDDNTATVTVNGVLAIVNNGSFVASGVVLAEGANTLTATATDPSGNSSQSSVNVTLTSTITRSIWDDNVVPRAISNGNKAAEFGVRFQTDVAGQLLGLRFYKAPQDAGPHIGNLWASDGTLLASVVFTNETESGWQQAMLATPVAVVANTTYIASYHTASGRFAISRDYFLSDGYDNPPLRALATGEDGGNGLYRYGVSGFPTGTYHASNYWVDVVFSAQPDTAPPVLEISAPANGAQLTGSPIAVSGTIDDNTATVTVNGVLAIVNNGSFVASGVALAEGANTLTATATDPSGNSSQSSVNVTLLPDVVPPLAEITAPANGAQLTNSSIAVSGTIDDNTATVTVNGVLAIVNNGSFVASGVVLAEGANTLTATATDPSGNSSQSSVNITLTSTITRSIWDDNVVPRAISNGNKAAEFGVRFQTDVAGQLLGLRFYKAPQDAGPHIGNLWASDGTLLASVVFTNETESGWQQAMFATPVAVVANTTYIASYHTASGRFAISRDYFLSDGYDNPPLRALATGEDGGNGLYRYGVSGFPTGTYHASNYWVDVVFSAQPDTAPPVLEITAPANGAQLTNSSIAVSGTIDDNTATVTVNGVLAIVNNGSFVASGVALAQGANTLTATATDPSGNSSQSSINVTLLPDVVPPLAEITAPANGAQLTGSPITVSGTIDDNTATVTVNGVLAIVNNGSFVASGVVLAEGANTLTATATDPSGNSSQSSVNVTLTSTITRSIWDDNVVPRAISNGNKAAEFGVRFQTDVAGQLLGLRFYKAPQDAGPHIGNLWASDGTLLASVVFTNETESGWQQAMLATPVAVVANTTYIASYHTASGRFAISRDYFLSDGYDNPPLRALATGEDGGNGLYRYGVSGFPTGTYHASNYWVDVVFDVTN